jgi:monothiol glutaredoxin
MTTDEIQVLSPADAQQKLEASEAVIIDVRMAYDWAGGRVHGSINLPNNAIQFRRGEVPPDKTLIFMGRDTAKGEAVAKKAKALGFENVYVVEGGWDLWVDSGMPTETISGAV